MNPGTLIDTIHRLKSKDKYGNKDIVLKLCSKRDKLIMMHRKDRLTSKYPRYRLLEHFCKETEANRRILEPIMQQARKDGCKSFMINDRLIIDKTAVEVDELHKVPEKVKTELCGAEKYNKVIAFMGKSSPFSNFYPAKVRVGKHTYPHNEKFIQSEKALFCRDMDDEIMRAESPEDCKRLGNKVRGFKELQSKWETEKASEVAYTVNKAKFTQNAYLRKILLRTKGLVLVEASKKDEVWGCGIAYWERDFLIKYRRSKGQGIQGMALNKVLSEINSQPTTSNQ